MTLGGVVPNQTLDGFGRNLRVIAVRPIGLRVLSCAKALGIRGDRVCRTPCGTRAQDHLAELRGQRARTGHASRSIFPLKYGNEALAMGRQCGGNVTGTPPSRKTRRRSPGMSNALPMASN